MSRGGEDTRTPLREEPEQERVTAERPIRPPRDDVERWNAMPPSDRFKDSSYQRWAQSFRSRESLSETGKKGYQTTVRLYGREFMYDRAADKRREQEIPKSLTEHKVVKMLEELGQKQDRSDYGGQSGNYFREYKLAPLRHADFAWPDRNKAIEAWGGVHTARFFIDQEKVQEENQRQIERTQAAGWDVMIVRDEDLTGHRWEDTRERVKRFLK